MSRKLRIPFSIYGFFCLLCLLSAIAASCLFDQTEDNIGLVVGSSHISAEKLKKDMEFISAGIEVPVRQQKQIRNQLIEQCINHYLIMEYGKEHDITISENELQQAIKDIRKEYTDAAFDEALLRGYVDLEQWKNRLRDQLLVEKIIGKAFSINQPDYQELKHYFEENQEEFRYPKTIEFRQIVTRTREEAENLLKRLHNGEQMSELAKKHSIAPEAENGGKVGWVAEGDLSESMGNILFSLSQGKISPVVETPYGYHIFKVMAVRPAGQNEFSDVIEEIQSKLLLQKREAFLKEWLKNLRSHFEVKINQDLLNELELS